MSLHVLRTHVLLLIFMSIQLPAVEEFYEFQGAPDRFDGKSFKFSDKDKTYNVIFANMKVKIQGYDADLDAMDNNINCDGGGNERIETCYVTVHNTKFNITLTIVKNKISGELSIGELKINRKK